MGTHAGHSITFNMFTKPAVTLTLTFDIGPKNHTIVVYPEVIPYSKFEDFRIIHFLIIVRTNKQNYRQTPIIALLMRLPSDGRRE